MHSKQAARVNISPQCFALLLCLLTTAHSKQVAKNSFVLTARANTRDHQQWHKTAVKLQTLIPKQENPYKVLFRSSFRNAFPTVNKPEFSTKTGSKVGESLGIKQWEGKQLSLFRRGHGVCSLPQASSIEDESSRTQRGNKILLYIFKAYFVFSKVLENGFLPSFLFLAGPSAPPLFT